MKKLSGIILAGIFFAGCGKSNEYSTDFGSAAFINSTPFDPPVPGTPAVRMGIFVDTLIKNSTGIAYGGNSGYLAIVPGERNIEVRSVIDSVTKYAVAPAQGFTAKIASTYVIFDTINPATGLAKLMRLHDTLTVAPAGQVKVRFLPLAIYTPPLDITFLRTSATPNDSITFANQSFNHDPTEADINALSAFRTMPLGTYSLKIKLAGTQNVVGVQPLSLGNIAGTPGITGISTFFIAGTAHSQPLAVGLFRNYP